MEKLRQYLIDNYNMQNHRDTEDFAIEMLKTSHANYLEASKREVEEIEKLLSLESLPK